METAAELELRPIFQIGPGGVRDERVVVPVPRSGCSKCCFSRVASKERTAPSHSRRLHRFQSALNGALQSRYTYLRPWILIMKVHESCERISTWLLHLGTGGGSWIVSLPRIVHSAQLSRPWFFRISCPVENRRRSPDGYPRTSRFHRRWMEEFEAHMVVINTLVELSFVSFLTFIFPLALCAMGNLSVSVEPRTFIFTRSLDF